MRVSQQASIVTRKSRSDYDGKILLALPSLKSFSLAYLDVIYDNPSSSFSSDIPGDKLSLDTITL